MRWKRTSDIVCDATDAILERFPIIRYIVIAMIGLCLLAKAMRWW